MDEKEKEKVDKYQDLEHEIAHLIEEGGGDSCCYQSYGNGNKSILKQDLETGMLQKTVLVGTARNIRRVMSLLLEWRR